MWRGTRERLRGLLDFELAVADDGAVRVDHFCAGAGIHRLLGVDLSDAERMLLQDGETVVVVMACGRCIWERRLVLRLAGAQVAGG